MSTKRQLPLFAVPAVTVRGRVQAADPGQEVRATARCLPPTLRMGATGWTTPRWDGLVWAHHQPPAVLDREGLGPYAEHPLLRTVLLDRRAHRDTAVLRALAASTPTDFRFVMTADPSVVWGRLGEPRPNPVFLDPAVMTERSVVPFVEGLAERAGVLLIRIPSQDPRALGTRRAFPERLHRFVTALPKGPKYAVELRDHKLLTTQYAAALADCGAQHCISVHPTMPSIADQLAAVRPDDSDLTIVCWSMGTHFDYRAAIRNFAPYDALVDRDEAARASLVSLLRASADRPTYLLVDNMAEGCAPASIVELARGLATNDTRA